MIHAHLNTYYGHYISADESDESDADVDNSTAISSFDAWQAVFAKEDEEMEGVGTWLKVMTDK